MKLAAALMRVSTSQQELDSQIYDLRIKAKSLGYEIPDELIFGQKITGYDGGYVRDKKTGEVIRKEDRDSIIELKRACEKDKHNKISAIVIWEISRLSRKSATLLDYIEWFTTAEKPIYFTSHNLWTIDPITNIVNDNDIFMIKMLATFSEQERSKIMERYQRGKAYAITEKDRYIGGSIPYGYDLEIIGKKKYYKLHEERSKIIQDIFDKYLYDGWASDKIARYLNLNNIATYYNFNNPDKDLTTNIGRKIKRSEIKWSHTAVLQILRNPFYKGIRTYQELEVECTPIIDATIFDKVQELMKDNNKFSSKTRKFNYPLKPLLRCGECGSKFYGVVTSSKQLYYCNRFQLEDIKCNCNKINKYKLDGIIWSFISNTPYIYEYFKYLYSIDADANVINDLHQQNDLEIKEIEELSKRKSSLLGMFSKGLYSENELTEQALSITKEIKVLFQINYLDGMDESMKLYWQIFNKRLSNEKLLRNNICPLRLYECDFIDGSIIDIGCGQSEILLDYANTSRKIFAVDNEQEQLDMLKNRVEHINGIDINNWNFLNLNFPNDNLPTEDYSIIIMSNILHFFTYSECENIEKLIYKLGKKGTLIYIVVHSDKYYDNNPEDPNNNDYFKHYFSIDDLQKLFSDEKYEWVYSANIVRAASKDDVEFLNIWLDKDLQRQGLKNPDIIAKIKANYLKNNSEADLQIIVRKKD